MIILALPCMRNCIADRKEPVINFHLFAADSLSFRSHIPFRGEMLEIQNDTGLTADADAQDSSISRS